MTRASQLSLACGATLFFMVGGLQGAADEIYFPPPESQGGWRKLEEPAEIRRVAEMDPGKLADLKQWLLDSDKRDFAAVVIRRGYIVLEVERGNSARTDSRRVASVSKAICATVLAIAAEQSQRGLTPKKMKFDDLAFDFIPWAKPLSDSRKAKITVKQLLNHTSGICPEATGARNDGFWEYILGHSGDERTEKLAFDPGNGCGYSTHALAHAALVCETVTGMPYDTFAIQALFKPIGVEHWWFQYNDGGEKYGRHPSHGMGMPACDLARIAYCMLRGGRWKDQQVIPKWFVDQTAAPTHAVKTPEMRWKLNPQTFSHGWELPARLSGEGGRSGAGIPADARAKPGSGGQYIAFVPSLDLVVARQTGSSGDWQFEDYLRRACASVVHTKAETDSAGKPFSIQQQHGITWLAKPNGDRFFSFGVCCVNMGLSRKEFDPDNPGYAAWQHYSDSNRWAKATLARLKSWRFSTIGGWSDFAAFRQCPDPDVAFAPVLHIGSTAGAPWWDMWDPKITDRMDQVAREHILALRDDPRLIGYYSDNEIGWWNAILFKMTLEQAPTSGQRQRLLKLLRETYSNDWSALVREFEPAPGVENWSGLEQHGMLFLRPGGNGLRVERRFLGMLAERYYSLIHDIIRKYDQRALILGDRYQSFYYPEVARACAPYVDAVSSNLNAPWNDGTFARFYLETLHALTGKPVLIGEFYLAARENRTGNKNTRGVYPLVDTQKERAAGFRNTLHALLRTPYVIGADWFQYYDQPTHGRYDGENFNFGLVDIHNQPYETLAAAAAALDLSALKDQPVPRPDASQGVPRAPRDPLGHFKPTLALKHWNRERGFVKPVSQFPLADLYICWNISDIYLGLYAQDVVEDVFYKDKIVRLSDRAEWVVSAGESTEPVRARIGAGREPIVNQPTVRVVNISGVNGDVRNIAAMELPAKLFGKKQFKAGDAVTISSIFVTHGGGYRVEWKGSFTLSNQL